MSLRKALLAVGTAAAVIFTPLLNSSTGWAEDPPAPPVLGPNNSLAGGGIAPVTEPEVVADRVAPLQLTSDNAASARAAADWIVSTWQSNPDAYFAAGTVADGIIALSSVDLPDPVYQQTMAEMLARLRTLAPNYINPTPAYTYTAGLAKIIMTLDMANQDYRHFLGCDRDLLAELQAAVAAGGSSTTQYWAPHLIAISLGRLGLEVPQAIIDQLLSTQVNGGFGYSFGGEFTADPDYTAVGMESMWLIANSSWASDAQRSSAQSSVNAAIGWAQDPANQRTDAAGNYFWATYSAANSTGMLASALAEAGVNIESPQAFLRQQQSLTGTGAWSNVQDGTNSDVMATTQAVMGITGRGYASIRSSHMTNQVEPCDDPGTTVDIPDTAFRGCLAAALGKEPTATLTDAELAGLTTLNCADRGIQNVSGAEHLTALTELNLANNMIADLSPVPGQISALNATGQRLVGPAVTVGVATAGPTVTPQQGQTISWTVPAGVTAFMGQYMYSAAGDHAWQFVDSAARYSGTVTVTASEPAQSWREGACTGEEGVTVVIDYSFLASEAPGGAQTVVRCHLGDPASGWQALTGSGFALGSVPGFEGAAICSINGVPAAGFPYCWHEAYWSYWHGTANGQWEYSQLGAASYDPAPGGVEGWRFVSLSEPGGPPSVGPVFATATAVASPPEGGTATAEQVQGAQWQLTATANPGYRFVSWSDGATEATRTVTLTGDTEFVAQFALRFLDVPPGHHFFGDIMWLADQGITTGYADGRYGVGDPVLREQMVIFLYRVAGSPAVDTTGCHSFTDVPADSAFNSAICWAKQEGITTGYTATRFGYGDPVLREQMAAFIHRAAGSPAVDTTDCHSFTDVPADSAFNTAICWLKQEGITTGYTTTRYGYGDPVLREQMAAFIHRWRT